MKRLVGVVAAVTVLIAGALTAAAVAPTVVNHDGQFGWHIRVDPGNSTTFVNGPGTPPLGAGSVHLLAGNGSTGGDLSAQIRNTGYAGTRIKDITALGYASYMHTNNGQQFPYLSLEVASSGSGAPDERLFFEPPYQSTGNGGTCATQAVTVKDTWQQWNALTGCWWANSDPNLTPGIGTKTLAAYLVDHPNATIQNTATGLGGIRLLVGFASATDKFDGNVDAFTIGTKAGTVTYDFEKNLIATAISYTGDTSGVAGQPVHLSAILKESGTGKGVAGETLTFTLQGQTCSGVTDVNGTAKCTITAGGAGTATVTITYGGSTRYVAATQSASITIASAPALPKAGAGVTPRDGGPWLLLIALGVITTVVGLRLTLKRR